MNPEIFVALLPLALIPALLLRLLPPRGLPRVVVRVALMGPAREVAATEQPALPHRPAQVRAAPEHRRTFVATPRACEVRLAKNLRAWRERRLAAPRGGIHLKEIVS